MYDSDSELSIPDEVASSIRKRPSRAGASQTKKKIAKCMNASDDNYDSDSSSYGTHDDDDDDSSDDSETSGRVKFSPPPKGLAKQPPKKKVTAKSAAEVAREKQRQALDLAKNKKGNKVPAKKKGKNKKRFDEDSSDDDSVGGDAADPMDKIDMDELLKEAMAGARFSILHSFCWWRVVLDEAHYIKSRSSQTAAAAFSLSSIHRWW